jgi:hypothetical protein
LALGGSIWVVCKNQNDLILTEEDRKTHPAKWQFLTFIPDIPERKTIENNGTKKDLIVKVELILSS